MTTRCVRVRARTAAVLGAVVVLGVSMAGTAAAQSAPPPDPNAGALTFTGGFDVPTVYLFRGLVQEADPSFTAWPFGDVGLSLFSGDGGVKSAGVNFGVWNSLHTGSSGSGGPNDRIHYEQDFYATFALGFGAGMNVAATYTAYTSPNSAFNTVKELSVKVSKSHLLAPYGLVAFELDDDGQADGGLNRGSYLELGVGPSWSFAGGRASVAVPVKVGLSLSDYYELDGEDHTFGYFDVGGLMTVPLTKIPAQFGAWNVHAGLDVFVLGDTPKAFNDGDGSKVVGLFGVGVTY